MGEYYGITESYEEQQRVSTSQPRYRKELNRILSVFIKEAAPILEMRNKFDRSSPREHFSDEIEQCNRKLEECQAVATRKIETALKDYLARLDRSYDISGNKIDHDTLALLDPSRVVLTQEEFDRLAEKFLGNHTMEAALRTYANKTGLIFHMTKGFDEKRKLAIRVRDNAISFLYPEADGGLSNWLLTMDGMLFNEANILTE